jgi:hypothetical protein
MSQRCSGSVCPQRVHTTPSKMDHDRFVPPGPCRLWTVLVRQRSYRLRYAACFGSSSRVHIFPCSHFMATDDLTPTICRYEVCFSHCFCFVHQVTRMEEKAQLYDDDKPTGAQHCPQMSPAPQLVICIVHGKVDSTSFTLALCTR